MSDQQNTKDEPPLFQNMDEQERVYAPQQVPGAVPEPSELDVDETAGSGAAIASQASGSHEPDTQPGRPYIAGAEGDQRTAPVVAVRPDVSSGTSVALPADTDARSHDEPRHEP